MTASPGVTSVTFGPTCVTTPAKSLLSPSGKCAGNMSLAAPERMESSPGSRERTTQPGHRATSAPGAARDTSAMAYDDELANRVREVVHRERGLTEKRMFGGLAFLIDGNMAVSASSKGGLLLRVDPAQTESFLSAPHVRRFEMRGREMDGWLRLDVEALETDDALRRWVRRGVAYARSLPPK